MRVLYCNPVFFEYRLPFYKELVKLFKREFFVMYSPIRYKICKKERFCHQIKEELGENAMPLYTDHVFDTNSWKWDEMPDIEKGKRIPLTFGLMRTIKKIKPDVLITEGYFQWTPLVLLYGITHHIPVYLGYERTLHTERNTGKLKIWQRKLFNKFFAGFLVNGSETKKYLLSLGVNEERIHIGGMSADSTGFSQKVNDYQHQSIEKLKMSVLGDEKPNGLLYLFVGVVAERKGVSYLLSAWEEHVKTQSDDLLMIVGDGNQLAELKEKYGYLKSVRFAGRVEYEKIPQYYAIADVFILPTIEDNWSLVIPEAMACGLPVATSVYNGCYPELVHKDVNGITFDTYQQETIIEALDYFHLHDLKKMGEESIRLEKNFNTENCAQRVYEAIINVLK